MTTLRQRLTDELDLRGLSALTKHHYISAVARLAKHFGRSPDSLGDEELKAYLLHLIRGRGLRPNSVNVAVAALRFFFERVLGRSFADVEAALPRMRRGSLRPQVFSLAEVERLLAALVLIHTTRAPSARTPLICDSS